MPFAEFLPNGRRRAFLLFAALLATAALTGGSNRGDVIPVVFIRTAALLCFGAAFAWMPASRLTPVRLPVILLGMLAAWMIVQLIPLPPAAWTALPGRERLAQAVAVLGEPQPWHPLTLIPLRTINSLFSLLVPAAAIMVVAWLPRDSWPLQASYLVTIGLLSGLLALIQVLGPVDSIWYMYDSRQRGGAVGFFANRNHQAAMLACLIPLLGALGASALGIQSRGDKPRGLVVALLCTAAVLFVLTLIAITGSRAGLLLGLVGLVATAVLIAPAVRLRLSRRWLAAIGAAVVLGAGIVGAVLVSGQALSIQRLSGTEVTEEQRVRVYKPIFDLIGQNMPVGTGYGTFDPAFRAIEPYSLLYRSYLNHAHSDPLEFISDGGVPSVLILAGFILWWSWASFVIWRRRNDVMYARAGTIGTGLLMLASLVDYPLRTPLAMTVFAIFIAWMALAVAKNGGGTPQRTDAGSSN